MAESHVITGLKARRASIAADIDELDRKRRALLVNLRHVDGALKLMGFDGNPEAIAGRRKRRAMFRRGELRRFILNAEREHGADLSAKTVAVIILQKMGWTEEPELLAKIEEKVRYGRKDLRRKAPSTEKKNRDAIENGGL